MKNGVNRSKTTDLWNILDMQKDKMIRRLKSIPRRNSQQLAYERQSKI